MIAVLLGAALVVIVALLVASAELVRERNEWRSYAEGLNERIDTELGVER